jgi:hypothetical protein
LEEKKKEKKENKCKNLNICQDLIEFGKILTPKSLKKKKKDLLLQKNKTILRIFTEFNKKL